MKNPMMICALPIPCGFPLFSMFALAWLALMGCEIERSETALTLGESPGASSSAFQAMPDEAQLGGAPEHTLTAVDWTELSPVTGGLHRQGQGAAGWIFELEPPAPVDRPTPVSQEPVGEPAQWEPLEVFPLLPDCEGVTAIYHGSLELYAQEDLDQLAQYREVTGDVQVWLQGGETAIDARCLQRIGGNLFKPPCVGTGLNDSLERVLLPSLTEVGGDLMLWVNDLQQVSLPSLNTVGGMLSFHQSSSLQQLELPSLSAVGVSLVISGPPLESLQLPALETVGYLAIEDMDKLTSFSLPSLVEAPEIYVESMTHLETFSFPVLEQLELIVVRYNPSLTSFTAPGVSEVEDAVRLVGNDALTGLGLSNVTHLGNLEVSGNGSLNTLVMEALSQVSGSVVIDSPEWLPPQPLHHLGLGSLQSVGLDLAVQRQPSLATLDISTLQEVGGDFVLAHNTGLSGFGSGSLALVQGDFVIAANEGLLGFCLPQLTHVGGDFRFEDALWGGLSGVALPSMAAIGGDVVIAQNYDLVYFPLSAGIELGGDLWVHGNISLPQCWLGHFIAAMVSDGSWSGQATIEGNDESCECTDQGGVVAGSCS